jgi:hypothetical protein
MVLRVLPGLFGALFLYIAASWLLDPVGAAAGLQMELFDGAGRSSQIGDIGGFFLGSGSLLVLGAWRKSAALLRGAAIMVGAVGVMRILAWAFQDAAFATSSIAVEVVITGVALFVASRFEAEDSAAPEESAAPEA